MVNSKILSGLKFDPGYLIVGLIVVELIIVILFLVVFLQNMRIKRNYKTFMQGEDGKSLEKSIIKKFKEVDELNKENKSLLKDLEETKDVLQHAFQKVGLVKYDAFKEMGGKLSFSLCLLDNKENGILMTSMHTREGCYTYVKEIIKGESYVILAEEERQALEQAKTGKSTGEF